MSNPLFGAVWDEAEGGLGGTEVIPPGEYQITCVKADVGSNDRIWSIWNVLTGPLAGTEFFGPGYGLQSRDPAKKKKVAGLFKGAMISFGVTEQFFKSATSLADFAAAMEGVQGTAVVKIRDYKVGDENRQSNDFRKFTLTGRPALQSVGGIPQVQQAVQPPAAAPQPAAVVPAEPPVAAPVAPAAPLAPVAAPLAPAPAAPLAPAAAAVAPAPAAPVPAAVGVPGTPDGPPAAVPLAVVIDHEPNF